MQVSNLDLLAQITEAVIAIDLQERVLFWGRGAERMYGLSAEEMLGRPLSAAYRYQYLDPQQEHSAFAQLRKTGRWFGENLHILNDGRRLVVESEVSALGPLNGNPVGYIAVIRDMTAQREREMTSLAAAESAREAVLQEWKLASAPLHQDIQGEPAIREALRQSNSRFRRLFESDVVGFIVSNGSGRLLDANDYFLRMVGYGREDLPRLTWLEMTPPEYWPLDRAGIAEALSRGSCSPYEKEYIRSDGSRIQVLIGYATTEAPDDHFICIVLDISPQKRAEAALRSTEAQLRTLTDAIPMQVWRCNSAGECNYLSNRWMEFAGATLDELLGYGWLQFVHPEDQAPVMAVWQRSVREGTSFETQFRIRRHDGEYRWFLTRAVPFQSETGETSWFGSNTDITAEREVNEALASSEKRFRELAQAVPQLIWVTNAVGENIWCNGLYMEYLGCSLEDTRGFVWQTIIHPEDLEHTLAKWEHCASTGEPYLNEYRLRRHDGEYRYFLSRAVALRNEVGEIQQWIGSSTDVHDQKLAEEALRRSEKLAAAGRLAASIAHEINNPLAAVTNSLYLAMQEQKLPPRARDYLDLASQELQRVAHVTTQMLRFHRQSSGARAADLAEIMESVFVLYGPRLRDAGITVERDYATHRPLYCYNNEIRQVLANLIGNALDAMQDGGRLRIRIREAHRWNDARDGGVRITVGDTGHGITPAIRRRLYEPFITTKGMTGTGLGLWVSDEIIRKHGGNIRVHSRADESCHGTVFSIFLPFDGVPQEAAELRELLPEP